MRQQLCTSRVFTNAGTYFTESVYDDVSKDCAFSSIVEALTATSAQVTVQESPSADTIADGAAVWLDIAGFSLAAQGAVGALKGVNANPLHRRKRLKVVIVGAGSATITGVLEGQRKFENDYR